MSGIWNCQYQGQLVVPFFNTPYTIQTPDGAGTSGRLQMSSENPYQLATTAYNGSSFDGQLPSAQADGVGVLLTPKAAYSLSLGKGVQTAGYTATNGATCYMDNTLYFNLGLGNTGYSNHQCGFSWSALPWFGNRALNGPLNFNTNNALTNFYAAGDTYFGAATGPYRVWANYGVPFEITKVLMTWGRGGTTDDFYCGFTDPKRLITRFLSPVAGVPAYLSGVAGSQQYTNLRVVPDANSGSNFGLSYGVGNIPKIFNFSVNMLASKVTFSSQDFVLTFVGGPNPNANNSLIYADCANGWLINDANHGAEYYMSADCTKYWLLKYVAGASGVVAPGYIGEPGLGQQRTTHRMIDKNGIMWDVSHNTGGTTIQPVFSLAFNIPFSVKQFPAAPPFKVPCWNPCCGTDVGLTRIADGEQ